MDRVSITRKEYDKLLKIERDDADKKRSNLKAVKTLDNLVSSNSFWVFLASAALATGGYLLPSNPYFQYLFLVKMLAYGGSAGALGYTIKTGVQAGSKMLKEQAIKEANLAELEVKRILLIGDGAGKDREEFIIEDE